MLDVPKKDLPKWRKNFRRRRLRRRMRRHRRRFRRLLFRYPRDFWCLLEMVEMEPKTFRTMRTMVDRRLPAGSKLREFLPQRWEETADALVKGGLLKKTAPPGGAREYALTADGHEHLSRRHEQRHRTWQLWTAIITIVLTALPLWIDVFRTTNCGA